MFYTDFYSLSENVSIRKENCGIVLIVKNNHEDYNFFYVSDFFELFLKMFEEKSFLKVNNSSLIQSEEDYKKMYFVMSMIKEGVLIHYTNNQQNIAENKIIELKKVPKVVYLFITPATHFRKLYLYGK